MNIATSSEPAQLSLLSECHPEPFVTAWSKDNPPHPTSGIYCHANEKTRQGRTALNRCTLTQPDGLAAPASWNVCMACDQSYALPAGLGKHQRTVCERTRYWQCRPCRNQIFEKVSELHQHHLSDHGDTCFHCYNETNSSPSDHCKAYLSQWSIDIAKKAYGCPCCIGCFDTLRDWNKHKTTHWHRVRNGKVSNWSFSTMVRSLLRHCDLFAASRKYDWSLCDWAYMKKNDCRTLRFALERHVIPSPMFNNEIYSHFTMPYSLVLHTFALGTVRDDSAASLNAIILQRGMNPGPAFSNVFINDLSDGLPWNLNCHEQDCVQRRPNFESDESRKCPSNTLDIASAEAADGDEPTSLDIGPVEYKRAIGVSKTRLADEIGYLRSQQGPEPLANYIPSSQNGSRVPVKVQNPRKRFRNSEVERKAG
jgi:hypothetical protein